jgi:hypothetical protein
MYCLSVWARRSLPDEWVAVSRGSISWSQMSPRLRAAYVLTAVVVVIPGVVITKALFKG